MDLKVAYTIIWNLSLILSASLHICFIYQELFPTTAAFNFEELYLLQINLLTLLAVETVLSAFTHAIILGNF